ncbi:MAG: MFS transporter [Anaerolineae bacterium]|nr:MFS transporter [Anaerolineae bacterium]MDW8172064.1 MFS transporter [Anaerolineae bacterium]
MKPSTRQSPDKWRSTLAIVCFAQLFTSTGFSLIFPFLPLYVKSLGSTFNVGVELASGLVFSVTGITMMIASPLWGAVADRVGRKPMVLRATIGGTVLLFLMGCVQSVEQLLVLRALQGAVTGTIAANNALVAAVAPRERMGFAMGTLQVSLWAGVALGPLLGGVLADAFGFAMPFSITAAMLALSSVMIGFGVHENFHAPVPSNAKKLGLLEQWSHVLHARGVPTALAMRFMAGLGRTTLVPVAPLFVLALLPPNADHTSTYTGLATSLTSASATISGVMLGRYGDRVGHAGVLVLSALFAASCYLPQVIVQDYGHFLLLQVLAGVGIGGVLSSLSALLAQYTQPGEEGAVYGLDNAMVSGSQAIAPLVGSLVAVGFGLRGTFALTALLFFCAAFFAYKRLLRLPTLAQLNVAPAVGD